MKQKSSTAEHKPAAPAPAAPETVLLRNLDTKGSEEFEPEHARRLLKYRGTRYAAIDAGNDHAGAAATAPAAPSEPDATGHPTEV